ncbi:DUF2490 domain-containing protein [Sphingomonas sp.]|uniref:DUF2490 domain-containing protein n=1 Tax=Sphingomonas sp. TaxID=28214 RepID=UPI0038B359D7
MALSLAAIGTLGASTAARASTDAQLWAGVSATVKLSAKWRLSQDAFVRFSDNRNGLYEFESNTLVGFRLSKVTTLWAGYTHDPQYAAGHFTTMERRAREQVTFDNFAALGPGKLSGRIRFEERWREGVGGTGWRIRPYLKYSLPLRGKVALNLSTEPFFDLNTTGFQRTPGLDRVRNLATVSVPLSKRLTGEAGYMNQHGFVRGAPDTSDNIAYFALNFSG